MSSCLHVTQQELDGLGYEYRYTSDRRYADRIKVVYLLGSGWPVGRVAQALMIDRESVHNHQKRYHKGGRQRLNINGVIDCNDLSAILRYDGIINTQSTIKLFQQIELQNPGAERIQIICDNARYYHAQLVKDYLANSRIELVFLTPYAPNLNLIERFWKFFKKTVLTVWALLRNLFPIQNSVRQLLCRIRPAPCPATLVIDRSLSNHRSRLSAKI